VATLENPDHEALIVGAGFGGIAAAIARAEMWFETGSSR
jgi:cation diffusion facilitator CzcD-associated flavoprotein CzcO